jgi:uncharacterized protein DUF3592
LLWKMTVFADGVLLLSLVASVTRWLETRHRAACGGRTEDTVTGHRRQLLSSGPSTWTSATLVFAIVSYRDQAGREHATEVVGDLPVGETVSVLFNPDKPHRAFAESRGGSVTYLVISMALLAAAAGCAVIAATAS